MKTAQENNEKNIRFFPKSNIVKPNDEYIILSWFDKKPISFNLLFDSKIDGDLTSTFYQRCEN